MPNGPIVYPPDLNFGIRDTVTGANGASLTNYSTAELPDGAHVYVVANASTYVLNKSSSATPFGEAVVAAMHGGRWFQNNAASSTAANIEVWVASNNNVTEGVRIYGFTVDQVAEVNYVGDPAVALIIPRPVAAVAHDMAQYGTGLLVSTSEGGDVGPESVTNPESTFWLPNTSLLASKTLTPSDYRRLGMPAAMSTSSRSAAVLAHGPVCVVGRNGPLCVMLRDQVEGSVIGYGSKVLAFDVVSPGRGLISGPFVSKGDAAGNYWTCSASFTGSASDIINTVRFAKADIDAGTNPLPAEKWFNGSNWPESGHLILDAVGGMWHSLADYSGLQYHTAAQLAAGSGVASNPAPTRSITNPVFLDGWGGCIDREGNLWFCVYGFFLDPPMLYRIPKAQLDAGGAVTFDRSIALPSGFFAVGVTMGYGHAQAFM